MNRREPPPGHSGPVAELLHSGGALLRRTLTDVPFTPSIDDTLFARPQ